MAQEGGERDADRALGNLRRPITDGFNGTIDPSARVRLSTMKGSLDGRWHRAAVLEGAISISGVSLVTNTE